MNDQIRDTNLSYLTLRKALGILGLLLPFALILFNGFEVKSSISHFYYSNATVVFTGFMFAFGIFLISYRGRIGDNVIINDNAVTSIGGAAAIATACIPTAFCSDTDDPLIIGDQFAHYCNNEGLTLQFIHNDSFLGTVHLICAGLFLVLMGYMSFFRFTKGDKTNKLKINFYRFCGVMVWLPVLFLGFNFKFEFVKNEYIVLICEWIALLFFGFAWMVKGKTFEKLKNDNATVK